MGENVIWEIIFMEKCMKSIMNIWSSRDMLLLGVQIEIGNVISGK